MRHTMTAMVARRRCRQRETKRRRAAFHFQDSSGNTGIGTITRDGGDLLVSLKPTRVVEKDCIAFTARHPLEARRQVNRMPAAAPVRLDHRTKTSHDLLQAAADLA